MLADSTAAVTPALRLPNHRGPRCMAPRDGAWQRRNAKSPPYGFVAGAVTGSGLAGIVGWEAGGGVT